MNESDARSALLVRAYETLPVAQAGRRWRGDDRVWATQAAPQDEGAHASAADLIACRARRALPAAWVAANSQYGAQDADYRVFIDVQHFESVPGESVTLEAAWSVRNRAGGRLRERNSMSVEPVSEPAIAALVAAHAKALDALAREIAAAVEALAGAQCK